MKAQFSTNLCKPSHEHRRRSFTLVAGEHPTTSARIPKAFQAKTINTCVRRRRARTCKQRKAVYKHLRNIYIYMYTHMYKHVYKHLLHNWDYLFKHLHGMVCTNLYVSRHVLRVNVCVYRYMCMHTYVHAYRHTHTHTYIHTYIHTYKVRPPCIHPSFHPSMHEFYTHTYMCNCVYIYIYTHMPACIHSHKVHNSI